MSKEAIELLSRYLQIDTTNPPGNELKGVAFFANILDKERVDYKIYEATPGRQSIKATIPGTGEKGPIMLLNHIDVVPVQADQWSFNPFSGEVKDGFIHGRDLIFLAAADEEAGGKNGVEYLLENYPDDFKVDFVLNEGGYGINDILLTRPVFMISTAEKGLCWLKLTRTGAPGHGIDERVLEENMIKGTEVYTAIVKKLCGI